MAIIRYTKVATFITLTQITSKDGEIITTDGNYETEIKQVNLFKRSVVKDSAYTMEADTIFYDEGQNLGFAEGDVIVQQEDSTLEIRGQYGQFNRLTDESMLTNEPVAIQMFEDDTLYLFADTLMSKKVKVPDKSSLDTVSITIDSLLQDSIFTDSTLKDSTDTDLKFKCSDVG